MTQGLDEDRFDAIVVGGGVAGAVCAYQLARSGREVVLIERGTTPGSKNLSGGVFYCRVMDQVLPGFVDEAPTERRITRHVLSFLNPTSAVSVDYWDRRLAEPVNAVSVLRAKLDPWLVERCEDAGVMVLPGVRVDSLLREGERIVGVRAGDDELRARVVVAADGVNSFLARDAGLRTAPDPRQLAVGVKSVIALRPEVIRERFHCGDNEGAAYAMVGDATQGCAGGGFLYTNTDSVSVGVVLRLDDLASKALVSSDVHDHLLAHPSIAPLIEGGELLEYGCHLTIEDGPGLASGTLAAPGLVLVGDAAGFTLNTGLTIRGMDLAAGSAIAAAAAIDEALDADDPDLLPNAYRRELDDGFVGQDLRTYADAPAFLDNQRLYRDYGPLLADLMGGLVRLDGTPHAPARQVAKDALRASRVTPFDLAKDAWRGVRAL